MTDDTFELSRRKILAGAGAVGAAGAGAGLGTSALFTDEEGFVNNSITAGTLDMSISAEIVAANDEYINAVDEGDVLDYAESANGEVGMGFTLEDFKPGDWVIVCVDITVLENPGCVTITTENLRNDDNGLTEPESDVDSTGGDGEGELGEHLVAEAYRAYTGPADAVSGDPRDHLIGRDSTTPAGATLNDFHDTYSTGVTIGGSPGLAVNNVVWYLLFELPRDAGNAVQSDSVAFDATFDAVQARNNEDCAVSFDGVERTAEPYFDLEVAEADGYMLDDHCVSAPEELPFEGAMGFHAVNPALVDDTVNQLQPEALVYEPTDSDPELFAVEYLSTADPDGPPPKVLGQEMQPFPEPFANWALHVWIWKENPAGVFAPFNPDVSCPPEE